MATPFPHSFSWTPSVGQALGRHLVHLRAPRQGGYGGGTGREEILSIENQGGDTALTSFPSTTGEEAARGDRLIHDQDLAWLQQADGEWPFLLPRNSSGVLDPLNVPGLPT